MSSQCKVSCKTEPVILNSNHKTKTFVTFIILLKAPLVSQGVKYLNTFSPIWLSALEYLPSGV